MAQYIEDYLPVVKYAGLNTQKAVVFESTLAVTGAITATGGLTSPLAISTTNGTIYPIVAPNGTVAAQTADATLVAADLNKISTNTGASGTITLTLPAVAGLAGYCQKVWLSVAQIVRIDPAGTETIFLGGSGVAGKYLNIAAVIGNYCDIYCDGSRWLVVAYSGVLTKEA